MAVNKDTEEQMQHPTEIPGLPTGIRALDEMLGGLDAGLYLLAARPSMGKTAIALQIASNVAADGHAVMIFSLEMSPHQITRRIICSWAAVAQIKLRQGKLDHEAYALFQDDWRGERLAPEYPHRERHAWQRARQGAAPAAPGIGRH